MAKGAGLKGGLLSRTAVRAVKCPKCGAWPRKPCWVIGTSERRASNHRERVAAAQAAQHEPQPAKMKVLPMRGGTSDADTVMPYTGLSREECRLVSCPACGASPTDKCYFPGQQNPAALRQMQRIHVERIGKAREYRAEGRI